MTPAALTAELDQLDTAMRAGDSWSGVVMLLGEEAADLCLRRGLESRHAELEQQLADLDAGLVTAKQIERHQATPSQFRVPAQPADWIGGALPAGPAVSGVRGTMRRDDADRLLDDADRLHPLPGCDATCLVCVDEDVGPANRPAPPSDDCGCISCDMEQRLLNRTATLAEEGHGE